MNNIYYSLVLLVQRTEMKKAEPGSRIFEEMLDIKQEDKIGKRQIGDTIGESDKAAVVETDSTDKEDQVDDEDNQEDEVEEKEDTELNHGVQIMQAFSISSLRNKHDPRGELKDLSERDKVLISYLFFKEFEEEYSFILTTPKIELNVVYSGGMKIDHHQKLADIYEESRPCYDMFKKYIHEASEYNKFVNDQGHVQNYVEHAKKVSILESRRGVTGRQVRNLIKVFMSKVEAALGTLKDDIDTSKQIVLNPDEQIKFDLKADQKKRLKGKPIKECIMEVYCFVKALAFRIEKGDLFGGVIEMSQEEFENNFESTTQPSEPY